MLEPLAVSHVQQEVGGDHQRKGRRENPTEQKRHNDQCKARHPGDRHGKLPGGDGAKAFLRVLSISVDVGEVVEDVD